jgi:stage II sporulation protein AA (anti-sigma F factor antagonist)
MENIQKPEQVLDDIWAIKCADYIDAHNADTFERYIRDALKQGQVKLVLDFSELNYLASTGCNVILGYLGAARKKGGDIIIMKLNRAVMEVLRLLGLYEVINVVDDMDSAIAFFKRQDNALNSGELKVEDLVAQAGGSGDEEAPLPEPSEWDGTKVPDPIDMQSFGKKKDKDKADDAAGADDGDPDKPLNLTPDDVVEIPKTPVEEVPETEKKKEESKKPIKDGEKKSVTKNSPAPLPRKERSKRKRREKVRKKAGKKKKKNRGKRKKK